MATERASVVGSRALEWDREVHGAGEVLRSLLTIEQVASILQVSPKTVRRLIARRGLPHIRFGRVLRFERGDVFRWLQARKEG